MGIDKLNREIEKSNLNKLPDEISNEAEMLEKKKKQTGFYY